MAESQLDRPAEYSKSEANRRVARDWSKSFPASQKGGFVNDDSTQSALRVSGSQPKP